MKLEVGKTYRHSNTGNSNKFKIEAQWSSNLFEGRIVDPRGVPTGKPYLFNISGEALGWRGSSSNSAVLGWRLREDTPLYEYRLIYDGIVDTVWSRLTPVNPRYTYASSKFILREVNNHSSTRLTDAEEIKRLQASA